MRPSVGAEVFAMPRQSVPDLLVDSAEGVTLAVYACGSGPPLLLVHGSLQDHSISAALVEELAPDFTCYSMDRRGFGASSDSIGYCIESEFDDIAAVVDHLAETTGRRVHLWGDSYGASCAMGAATRTANIDHLILYEPSLGIPYPPSVIDKIEEALAEDDGDTAIALVLREIGEFADADIDAMRATPEWARRVAVAATVPRECRAEQDWVYEPGRFDAVAAPTLLLAGSDSPDDLKRAAAEAAAAIPHATAHVLDGHAHIAHRTHPADVASIIVEFALHERITPPTST